jgi:hypothetical protein
MLPRTRGFLLLFITLCTGLTAATCRGQQAAPSEATVRYHFGDDPDGKLGWANPNFDDSSWPIAKDGSVPTAAFYSDGFVWARVHVAVPTGLNGPLAIRQVHPEKAPCAEELYVDGRLIGQSGRVPPNPVPLVKGMRRAVFPLATDGLSNEKEATIALRTWAPPSATGARFDALFEIDRESVLVTAAHDRADSLLLARMPEYIPFGFLFVIGLGLLFLWRITRRQELLLFGLSLIAGPAWVIFVSLSQIGRIPLHIRSWDLIYSPLELLFPALFVVFSWTALALPGRRAMHLLVGTSVASGLCGFVANWTFDRSTLVYAIGFLTGGLALLRDGAMTGILAWSLVRRPANRTFTALILLAPLFSVLVMLGLLPEGSELDLFEWTVLLNNYALAAVLVGRAWKAWREGNEYRTELASAREVQRRLVPAAVPAIEGYQISTAYLPAAEVGGDFYQVLEQRDGSALILVGDVSGKGLKAAMNGVLTIGTARALASEQLSPGMLLTRLNAELVGSQDGGFITCLCAHITRDGTATFANAGHLSPYRMGAEIELDSGLPLGIAGAIEYPETTIKIEPGESLLLLSDGVVEARNAEGELFGFERTRALSTESAERVARAAQAFGQEDDITVLTLTVATA